MYDFSQPTWDLDYPVNLCIRDLKPQDIRGKLFEEFIDLCFSNASYFSLSRAPWMFSIDPNLEIALEQYKIKTIQTYHWFCYFLMKPMEVYLYKTIPETKSVLLKYLRNIFISEYETEVRIKPTLEDLCFFSKEKLFMGTVAHEFICSVFPPNESFANALSSFGRWVYKEDSTVDQITLADYI